MKDVVKIFLSCLFLVCTHNCWASVNAFSLSCEKIQNATTTTSTDGVATFTINNGTPAYTFQLRNAYNVIVQQGTIPSESNITIQLNNLAAGSYTISVNDENDSSTCNFQIGANSCDLTVQLADYRTNCTGDKGALVPIITGGVAPLTYLWTNGASTQSIHNQSSGRYTLIVRDNAGCSQEISASIIEPNPILLFPTVTNATDFQSNDGAVKINVNGGTGPFYVQFINAEEQLVFEDQNFRSPITLTNLPAGKYFLKIEDNNGCQMEQWLTVAVNNCRLAVSVQDKDAACSQADNQLSAMPNNEGVLPFSYQWSVGATSATIENLIPGTYIVSVTDAVGCTAQSQGAITGNNSMTLSCTVTSHTSQIGAKDGEIKITLGHGTPNYNITLNNLTKNTIASFSSENNGTITVGYLYAGTYQLTVQDDKGCIAEYRIQLNDPTCDLSVKVEDAIISCVADAATLQAVPTQGKAPYTYRWNNGVTTAKNPNLSPGAYRLTVTDAVKCEMVMTAKVLNSFRDEDGDGFFVGCADFSILPGPDCDDNDPTVYPGAAEICDGKDNDCNGVSDLGLIDSDNDGVSDCADKCPNDPNKVNPGLCGCNVYEDREDYDGDGVIGCFDKCPWDKFKIAPGNCGCGVAESPDSDGDGVYDCNDACPLNPLKIEKGVCGCDAPGITNIELKNFSDCDGQGTSSSADDFFFADVYIYFDAAPELGGIVLSGDLNFYHNFENTQRHQVIVLRDQMVKSTANEIIFEAVYKGNEDCNYFYQESNPYTDCSQNACDVPNNILANVVGNHVALSWESIGAINSFEYKYRISGSQNWIGQWTDQNRVELCDLNPNTSYDYQVRSFCASGFSSPYVNGVFQTMHTIETCFAAAPSDNCRILDVQIIGVQRCHDRGTIYQSDDYFYADVLIYFDNIPTTGDLIIDGTLKRMIPITDLKNSSVHHIEDLKIYEGNGTLSLQTYFSDQMDCQKELSFIIPKNPCFTGTILPNDFQNKVVQESENLLEPAVEISLGPNPVQTEMTVNYTFKLSNKKTSIMVYNFLGQQKLKTETGNASGVTNLDVSTLKNGLYYLSIRNGGILKTIKFVKEDLQ